MTRKIYKSAQGKTVDLGALMLANEHVRAVGNMNVNARGDVLNSNNQIIDKKNRQVQRQYRKTTNVSDAPVPENSLEAQRAEMIGDTAPVELESALAGFDHMVEEPDITPEMESADPMPKGGLAAAIARSREVKQELEKTRRQQAQEAKLKKI